MQTLVTWEAEEMMMLAILKTHKGLNQENSYITPIITSADKWYLFMHRISVLVYNRVENTLTYRLTYIAYCV